MRTLVMALVAILFVSTAALAQGKSQVEVGTALGMTLEIPDDGDTEVTVGLPGAGTLIGLPSVYVTFLATPAVMIEPQFYFIWNSAADAALISGILQVGYLFMPESKASPYLGLNGGGFFMTEEGSNNSASVGLSVGYRTQFASGAAFRAEAGFRRWLSESYKLNELSLRLGLGAVF